MNIERKPIVKVLNTFFKVKGTVEEVKKLYAFRSTAEKGYCICVKTHDNIEDWLKAILADSAMNGFEILYKTEQGHRLSCDDVGLSVMPYEAQNISVTELMEKLFHAISMYDINNVYWQLPKDDTEFNKILTCHQYRNSIHESSDSCGNCNGALCEVCHTEYQVKRDSMILYQGCEETAKAVYEKYKPDYDPIIDDIISYYKDTDLGFDIDKFEKFMTDNGYKEENRIWALLRYTHAVYW